MHTRKTYFYLAMASFTVLLGMTFQRLFAGAADFFSLPDPYFFQLSSLTLSAQLGYLAALAVAAVVLWAKAWRTFGLEVVDELLLVHWPDFSSIRRATFIVIVTVVLSSLYLGFLDAFCFWASNWASGISSISST
jgi:preprotein translocase SecE subunit